MASGRRIPPIPNRCRIIPVDSIRSCKSRKSTRRPAPSKHTHRYSIMVWRSAETHGLCLMCASKTFGRTRETKPPPVGGVFVCAGFVCFLLSGCCRGLAAARAPDGLPRQSTGVQLLGALRGVGKHVLARSATLSGDGGAAAFKHIAVPILSLTPVRGVGFFHTRHLERARHGGVAGFCSSGRVSHCRDQGHIPR